MIAILGSGFGLYGYVPALAKSHPGTPLILEAAYEPVFSQRQELQEYLPGIKWTNTREDALAAANLVVIALRPEDQWTWGQSLSAYPNITQVLLEKPLAPTPRQSDNLLSLLHQDGKKVRVGYNFLFTSWGQELILKPSVTEAKPMKISWSFRAHHFLHSLDTWKKSHMRGGGVLRFYGIHIIAMLAALGYDQVVASEMIHEHDPDIPYRWLAIFKGSGLAECHVDVDSNAMSQAFSITQSWAGGDHALCKLAHPFEQAEPRQDSLDVRVDVVAQLCMTFHDKHDALWSMRYQKTNSLWEKIEAQSIRVGRKVGD